MIQAPGAHEQSPAGDTLRGFSPSCAVQGSAGHGASTISTSQSCRFHLHGGWGGGEGNCTKARNQRDLVRPQVPEGRLNIPL